MGVLIKLKRPGEVAARPAKGEVKSVDRALAILRAFDHRSSRLTIQEIAARARVPRPSVYRFIKTLMRHDFVVEVDETGQRSYTVGPAILELGRVGMGEGDLRRCAIAVMRMLAEKTGESIYLSVRQGNRAICIEAVDSATPLRYGGRVGFAYPLYAGSPKVILAYLEPSLRDHIIKTLELKPLTRNTIDNRRDLLRRLEEIRRRGYEVSHGEIFAGTKAIAAPILDEDGHALAVLSMGAPEERVPRAKEAAFARIVRQSANEITQRFHRKPGAGA
jgi:DNA-binding IclR family transcriptional regulator